MKTPHNRFGKAFVFAGLLAALSLGVIGSCSLRAVPVPVADIDDLDAKAQPYFDEARRNIPAVVKNLTSTGAQCKLCWLMARDKLAGTRKTQDFLSSVLKEPIIDPCSKGAKVYGCNFEHAGFLNILHDVNADYASIKGYALGGLAIETFFLKQTAAALSSVLGGAVTRLTATLGSGTVCAVADGPLPFGDMVGVALAAGGAAWSGYDLWKAHVRLPAELTALLTQAIRDCQEACRKEASR